MQVLQGRRDILTTIVIEGDIGRMIVILIHLLQLCILQIHNVRRSTSRIIDIRCSPEQLLIDLTHHLPIGILIRPLHLIKHYPLELSLSLLVQLPSPSLLPEIQLMQASLQSHIQIDAVQIVPVCWVGRGEEIRGEIIPRPGIHVGIDRSSQHIEEGIPDWVLLRATAREMFEYMRTS